MSARLIVLWRHGQTDYNAALRLQGQVDIPLNAAGVAQAERAAVEIAKLGPTRVVSSDLQRAAATAEALGRVIDVDVELDVRLRERAFGLWEGLTNEEIRAGWPVGHQAWRHGEEPAEVGAETRGEVAVRVAAAIREAASGTDDDGVLVAVAHGAALTLGLTALLELAPTEWFGLAGLDNCRWGTLVPNPGRRPPWRLTGHNLGVPGT